MFIKSVFIKRTNTLPEIVPVGDSPLRRIGAYFGFFQTQFGLFRNISEQAKQLNKEQEN
jgi:hypothetical protein